MSNNQTSAYRKPKGVNWHGYKPPFIVTEKTTAPNGVADVHMIIDQNEKPMGWTENVVEANDWMNQLNEKGHIDHD